MCQKPDASFHGIFLHRENVRRAAFPLRLMALILNARERCLSPSTSAAILSVFSRFPFSPFERVFRLQLFVVFVHFLFGFEDAARDAEGQVGIFSEGNVSG